MRRKRWLASCVGEPRGMAPRRGARAALRNLPQGRPQPRPAMTTRNETAACVCSMPTGPRDRSHDAGDGAFD